MVGFAGLPLPSQVVLELPQGRLRSRLPGEARYAPFSLLADAALETSVSAAVVEVGGPPSRGQLGGQLRAPAARSRALPSGSAWVARHPATLLPLRGLGDSSYLPSEARLPIGRSIPQFRDPVGLLLSSSEEVAGLVCWAGTVATVDLSHVSIAVDRLLRALWEPEWPDSLIDAVIAWENLVGTTTETAFRVTAALARLCDDAPTTRMETRKRLAAVYDAPARG